MSDQDTSEAHEPPSTVTTEDTGGPVGGSGEGGGEGGSEGGVGGDGGQGSTSSPARMEGCPPP